MDAACACLVECSSENSRRNEPSPFGVQLELLGRRYTGRSLSEPRRYVDDHGPLRQPVRRANGNPEPERVLAHVGRAVRRLYRHGRRRRDADRDGPDGVRHAAVHGHHHLERHRPFVPWALRRDIDALTARRSRAVPCVSDVGVCIAGAGLAAWDSDRDELDSLNIRS